MTPDRQSELIAQYCSGMEERIQNAESRERAERIARETCAQLEQSCLSEVIREFLRRNVQAWLDKYWGEKV